LIVDTQHCLLDIDHSLHIHQVGAKFWHNQEHSPQGLLGLKERTLTTRTGNSASPFQQELEIRSVLLGIALGTKNKRTIKTSTTCENFKTNPSESKLLRRWLQGIRKLNRNQDSEIREDDNQMSLKVHAVELSRTDQVIEKSNRRWWGGCEQPVAEG
jgi:hypothetical protein